MHRGKPVKSSGKARERASGKSQKSGKASVTPRRCSQTSYPAAFPQAQAEVSVKAALTARAEPQQAFCARQS